MKNSTLPKFNQNHFRQIVETVNCQLAQQFSIEKNYAHGFWGLVSRLYTKLTARSYPMCIHQSVAQQGRAFTD